jgi:hypothetical protein
MNFSDYFRFYSSYFSFLFTSRVFFSHRGHMQYTSTTGTLTNKPLKVEVLKAKFAFSSNFHAVLSKLFIYFGLPNYMPC